MDIENTENNAVSETQVVAEANPETETSAVETGTASIGSEGVVPENASASPASEVVAKPRQSPEENSRFAAMRRETERLKAELESEREKSQRLFSALNTEGYTGTDAESYADSIEAARENTTVAEIRARREAEKTRIAEAVKKDPDYIRNRQEAEKYREMVHRQIIENDLREINGKVPGANIKDISELGEDYTRLRASGISNLAAYYATVGATAANAPAPSPVPDAGPVNGSPIVPEKEFYTSDEIDALTAKDLDNDTVYEKAIKSLSRLKSKK